MTTKWTAIALGLLLFPIAVAVADEPKKKEGKTEPAGVPLELKLTAVKATYPLELGGLTPEAFRKKLKETEKTGRFPPAAKVEFTAELRNTGDKAISVKVAGDNAKVFLEVKGKNAFNYDMKRFFTADFRDAPFVELAAGKSTTIKIASLMYGFRNMSHVSYWTEAGEYTVTARLETRVMPKPEGSEDGGVKVFSNSVKVKVTAEEKKDKKEKNGVQKNPADAPLKLRLIAKKTAHKLDLDGKSEKEYREMLEKRAAQGNLPAPPAIDIVVELTNTSDKDVKVWIGAEGRSTPELILTGPGAVNHHQRTQNDNKLVPVRTIVIAPGKTHEFVYKNLQYGFEGRSQVSYWTKSGDYELAAKFGAIYNPPPKGVKTPNAIAELKSNTIKLKVTK